MTAARVVFGVAWVALGIWLAWYPRGFAGAILTRGGWRIRLWFFLMAMFFGIGLVLLSRTILPPWSVAVAVAGVLSAIKAVVLLQAKGASVLALWSEEIPAHVIRVAGLVDVAIGIWIIMTV